MAARSIEAFCVREDEVDLELRFIAGEEPGGVSIEVRHNDESLGFVIMPRALSRECRLAIDKLEKLAKDEPGAKVEPSKSDAKPESAK